MDELREIAKAYFTRATEEVKEKARNLFRSMDKNKDGRISLQEFKERESRWDPNGHIFNQLDADGDGSLDFDEFLAYYYMVDVRIIKCAGCGKVLAGNYFSCLMCLGSTTYSELGYTVCCNCYTKGAFDHQHSAEKFLDSHARSKLLCEMMKDAEITQSRDGFMLAVRKVIGVGTAIGRVGTGIYRVATAIDYTGTAIEHVGTAIDNFKLAEDDDDDDDEDRCHVM